LKELLAKINTRKARMQAANLEGVLPSTAAGALWIPGSATRLFYKLPEFIY
jgi:hypothetical protein